MIESLGREPLAIAEEAGLVAAALSDRELPLRGETVGRFLSLAAERCGRRDFGLLLAERQGWSILGPIWLLMRNARTLGDALTKLEANFTFYATASVITLRRDDPRTLALCYDMRGADLAGVVQAIELGFAIMTRELRALLTPNWQPFAVQFRHKRPRAVSQHRRCFGDGLVFDQDRNAIVIEAEVLRRPLQQGEPGDSAVIERTLHYRSPASVIGTVHRTEDAIRAMLPHGPCSL